MTVLHDLVIFRDAQPAGSTNASICSALLSNLDAIRSMTIDEAAERCFTSPASLSRMVRAMGYQGYADFRTQLDRDTRDYFFANRVMPRIPDQSFHPGEEYFNQLETLLHTFRAELDLEIFPEIAAQMAASRRVAIYVGPVQEAAAVQLQVDLAMGGVDSALRRTPADQAADLALLDSRCFVILAYQSGTASGLTFTELLSAIREKGARLLLLAPEGAQLPTGSADYLLRFPSTGTAMDHFLYQIFFSLLTLTYRTSFLDRPFRP